MLIDETSVLISETTMLIGFWFVILGRMDGVVARYVCMDGELCVAWSPACVPDEESGRCESSVKGKMAGFTVST